MFFRAAILAFLFALASPAQANDATEVCTLIADADTANVVHTSGPGCDWPYSPASTFKVPLALIGFETGLLQDTQSPAEPYRNEYQAPFEGWRQTTTPTTWLRDSVVWYSQVLTRRLGMPQFQGFVDVFDYGDRDLTGDPGEANGLTHAWLSSSLEITPRQQVDFWHRLHNRALPVATAAYNHTFASIPVFAAPGGWTVHGKTGTALQKSTDGTPNGGQYGWFAGWMENGKDTYIFARLTTEPAPATGSIEGFAGRRTKDAFLAEAATLVPPR